MNEKAVLILHDGVKVRKSAIHGYGVFTDIAITTGSVIEECVVATQVIEHGIENLDGKEFATNSNVLNKYRFLGPTDNAGQPYYYVVPAGYAMMYNHSETPNVFYEYNQEQRIITFKALRDIDLGEELLTDYGPKYAL